jgi:hypothetical protein
LRRPGPPPAGLAGTAFVLLVLSLAAVFVLVQLGYAWHENPHHFYGEKKAGTYLSALNLAATGVVSGLTALRLRGTPFARVWWIAAVGFVWLGCDDLFVIHESIDRRIHSVLGWDPEDPITDHFDDWIVAGYGLVAAWVASVYRELLLAFRWTVVLLALATPLFIVMLIADFYHLSKTLEDGVKIVAGTLILVGFLAAWLQVSNPGGAR